MVNSTYHQLREEEKQEIQATRRKTEANKIDFVHLRSLWAVKMVAIQVTEYQAKAPK